MRLGHAENSIPALRQLMRGSPFAVLTTGIPSATHSFLQSTHLPFLLDVEDGSSETELGVLRGHLARQNPQSKAIVESLTAPSPGFLEQEVLMLFMAEPNHHITTKFYKETKPTTGKVVPTWNYAAAQAYGKAKIYYDSKSEATLDFPKTQLHDLPEMCERGIMGYTGKDDNERPWTLSEAPESFTSLLMKNVIGIDITISKLEGKFKMSQELQKADVEGVVDGLDALGTDKARDVADMVRRKNASKLE